MTVSSLIFLLSCASLNQNSPNAIEVENAVVKIDNRDYIVDMEGGLYDHEGKRMICTRKFIHVHGDSLIYYMEYSVTKASNSVRTECSKYKISKYSQTRNRRGTTEIYFWVNRYSNEGVPVDGYIYLDETPKRVILKIAPSGRVRVYMNDKTPVIGSLRS